MNEILLTKLFVPRAGPNQVARSAAIASLNLGLEGKLTLVSAPSGFGKTTLVAEWVRQTDRPFAWLSLDADDNGPVRLFAYPLAALQRTDPEQASLPKRCCRPLRSLARSSC
jgi:LuxR family maltose regulon positive regulatory protein